ASVWSMKLVGAICSTRRWEKAGRFTGGLRSIRVWLFSSPFSRITWSANRSVTRSIQRCNADAMPNPLLQLQDLSIAFDTNRRQIQPVRDVSFSIYPGQTLAAVGESGCGKSVTALSILRLIPSPPGKVLGGKVIFEGRDLLELSEREMRDVRGKDIAMIFQEPMTSLNP